MESLRQRVIRFHLWMAAPVPIQVPRALLVFVALFFVTMFLTVCAVSKMAQMMPKPVKVCPSGEPIYL